MLSHPAHDYPLDYKATAPTEDRPPQSRSKRRALAAIFVHHCYPLWALSAVLPLKTQVWFALMRRSRTDWTEAYEPFIDSVIEESAAYQVTNGGPIIVVQIDNEYFQSPTREVYFAQLEDQYRQGGIVVPLCMYRAHRT